MSKNIAVLYEFKKHFGTSKKIDARTLSMQYLYNIYRKNYDDKFIKQ